MRVLLIDVNCKNSSTGKIVYDLYNEINKREGWEAAICYGRGAEIQEPNIYKFSTNIEIYFHTFLTRVTGLTGCFSPLATLNLIRYIKKFKPDVIHIHELHGYFVNINSLIKFIKENNIKTIWTFHCEFMYTGKCGYAYECEKWKDVCKNCPDIKRYPKSLFFDFTYKMFLDKKKIFENFNNLIIVTPSQWLRNRVKESFLKDFKVEVIHNGIDTEIFRPQPYEDLLKKHNIYEKKIILSVAPDIMSERKGGKWVVKLASKFQNEDCVFILIGVKDLSENFPKNVIALGRTENQVELAKYYSMADLFLICSEKETFSMTCAEAISCGIPVIGFKSGAPETVFTESIFVDYGDIKTLKNKVIEFLESDKLDNIDIVNEGKIKYSKETMVTNYLDIYCINN